MNKYLKPIYHSNLKPWIKWWVLKRLSGGGSSSLVAVTITSDIHYLRNVDTSKALSIKEYYGNTVQDGTPTPEAPIEIQTITGDNSFQFDNETYTLDLGGKNLIDIENNLQGMNYGITTTYNADNSITLSGTATNTWAYVTKLVDTRLLPNTYTLSVTEILPFRIYINLTYDDNTTANYIIDTNNKSITFTTSKTAIKYRISLSLMTSGTTYNSTTKIMLCEGTDTTFSPYVSNPIELCKIGNYIDSIKKSSGKNLLNLSEVEIGKAWNNASNSARAVVYCQVEPNTTYYISYNSISNFEGVYWFEKADKTDTTATSGASQITTARSVTTKADSHYLGLQFNKTSISTSDFSNTLIQVELGETGTSLEPYGNNWYIEKNIGKVVLNGSESWAYSGAQYNYFRVSSYDFGNYIPKDSASDITQISSHFVYTRTWNTFRDSTTTNYFYILQNTGYKLAFRNTAYTEVEDFKTWLGNNNVSVYYPLATTQYETITNNNLIDQLNALSEFYVTNSNFYLTVYSDIEFQYLLEYYKKG